MFGFSFVFVMTFTIIIIFLMMVGFLWIGWWMQDRQRTLSPYTGLPLRRATELSYDNREKIQKFLVEFGQYDNRMFNLRYASFCRETGRVFPDSITWFGEIKVNWTFLQKRYSGDWLSWGSLNRDQQDDIREAHESLEGFQTEFSCPVSSPRYIEDIYSYSKPGPLYVDLSTKTLLGWKCVPYTQLEVLVVQKPRSNKIY